MDPFFFGKAFGEETQVQGEVVFNTGMVGYCESLTDPSYNGQILLQTYPLVGNYGVPSIQKSKFQLNEVFESNSIKVTGYAISELCEKPSHYSNYFSLNDWMVSQKIPGIYGLDTRELTKKLREKGVMLGILNTKNPDPEKLKKQCQNIPDPNLKDLVSEVSVKNPIEYTTGSENTVVVIDCGVKFNILRNLLKFSNVVRVPYNFTAEEILEFKPNGILISNGPGDPKILNKTIKEVSSLCSYNIPLFGICLGSQILALALGGDTYKLKYGHRGQNQPCIESSTKKCYITSHNHGYAIDPNLPQNIEPWFINANDGTIEGISHTKKPFNAVQFHPEHCPGPTDTDFIFNNFKKELKKI